MTDKKKMKYCFVPVPFIPAWEFSDDEDHEEEWENIKSTVNKLWEQLEDMQKESIDASKKQWDTFFNQTVKMQESFIDSLPDEAPSVPGLPPMPAPPKKRKELREERNKRNKEQIDSFLDYAKKRQDYIKDAITDGMNKAEEEVKKKKSSKTEKKDETKTAKKPRTTRSTKN